MELLTRLSQWGADLLSLIIPHRCEVCGTTLVRGEQTICLACNLSMPRCNIHTSDFNELHRRLMGHAPIERAGALFHYHRTAPHTRLIHAAKYSGRPAVASTLGTMLATEFSPSGFFDGIDLIVPVPLHPLRRLRRGYNQSHHIALGISSITAIPVSTRILSASRPHATQTRLSSFARWINVRNSVIAHPPSGPHPAHILLVDDVATTGATLLACAEAIHSAMPATKISVCTLAITALD